MNQKQKLSSVWRVFIMIGFFTLLVVGVMAYSLQQTINITAVHESIHRDIMGMENNVMAAHLWMQEIIGGDSAKTVESVRDLFGQAEKHLHGLIGEAFDSGEHMRQHAAGNPGWDIILFHYNHKSHVIQRHWDMIESVKEKMTQLRTLSEKIYLAGPISSQGIAIDQRFDRVFSEFTGITQGMMKKMYASKANHLAQFRSVQIVLIFLCLALGVLLAMIFNRFDRRKSEDLISVVRSKEALEESEDKYRTLIKNAGEAIIVAQDGIIKFANPKGEDLYGRSQGELSSRPLTDFIHEKDRDMVGERHKRRLSGQEPPKVYPFRIINQAGETKWVQLSAVPFSWDNKPAVLCYMTDITEHKHAEEEKNRLEAKLQQAQKMEAIGTLAGGVAHDLNNILSGIIGYPELILMDLPEESPLRKPLSAMQKSGEKAAVIVQDLLTLARRGVTIAEIVNLNHIISEQLKSPECEKLMSFHPHVHVETAFGKNLFNIKGSTAHLSKSFMNLISNATEAIIDGGTIFISTENRYLDRPVKGYDHVEEGDYVIVTVSDTGIGMSSEDMKKIFEPFYTKKTMGRSGTGLGMAVVWGTVKDHNGYIDIQSVVGKGTTLTFYFPATREKTEADSSQLSIEDYMGNGESILVIDDVEEQREIASRMLKKLGYFVTTLTSGEKAVEYMENNTADLLVLDMIMDPGIDGLDTYKRILEIHPKQKAIIASGFSETARVKEAINLGAGAYVKKPYRIEKIGVVVRRELEK